MIFLKILIILIVIINFSLSQVENPFNSKIEKLEKRKLELYDQIKKINKNIDSLQVLKQEHIIKSTVATSFHTILKFNAKLREKPSPLSETVGEVNKGIRLTVFDYDNFYWRVKHRNMIGYILDSNFEENDSLILMKNYYKEIISRKEQEIQKEKDKNEQEKQKEKSKILTLRKYIENRPHWIKTINANIRKTHSENSEIIKKLEKGDKVFIQSQNGEWYNIKIIDEKGPVITSADAIEQLYIEGWIHSSVLSAEKVTRLSLREKIKIDQEKAIKDYERQTISRRKNFVKKNPSILKKFRDAILKGEIMLGMSKEMVKASWGEPDDKNRRVSVYGTNEIWIYDSTYLHFDDGILTSWQD